MARRAPRSHTGRRSLLTQDLADKIVAAVKAGNYLGPAARQHGISESTLYQWLQQGEDARRALDNGEPVPRQAHIYAQFAESLQRARARAETAAVAVVWRVMEGGLLLEERPALTGDGLPIRGPDGEPMMERRYSQPDGKLALEYLRRSFPQRWAPQDEGARDEVGAGSAGGVGDDGQAARIVDRLAVFVERRELEAAVDPEGVVDAEVIDESSG